MDKKAPDVGTGLVGAPACGDVMQLQLRIGKDGKTIEDAVFKTFGCGSAIASRCIHTRTHTVRILFFDDACVCVCPALLQLKW